MHCNQYGSRYLGCPTSTLLSHSQSIKLQHLLWKLAGSCNQQCIKSFDSSSLVQPMSVYRKCGVAEEAGNASGIKTTRFLYFKQTNNKKQRLAHKTHIKIEILFKKTGAFSPGVSKAEIRPNVTA